MDEEIGQMKRSDKDKTPSDSNKLSDELKLYLEELFEKISGESSRKAVKALFSARTDELRKTYHSEPWA